jgi:hypothetical protein
MMPRTNHNKASNPLKALGLLLGLMACVAAISPSHAAGKLKPGLWEMSIKSDAMKSMPKIPPEQLEKLKQLGIAIPKTESDGSMVQKICISKEMAEREPHQISERPDQSCKTENLKQTGNSYSLDLICDGPNMKGKGNVKGSYDNNENFRSSYDFQGVARNRPVSNHVETTGKWLSADCGTVKPIADPQKKP